MPLSRRQLLTGSLAATGLTAVPWTARGIVTPVYQRGLGMLTTYKALSPAPMVTATRGLPGYAPSLTSVYTQLLQPGATRPLTTDPYAAALELVQRPWFRGLGSPDPIGQPPLPKLTRRTQFQWWDSDRSTGFHPVLQPVKRTLLEKDSRKAKKWFKNRATLQTQRICLAMLRRLPRATHPNDELAQGIRSLIKRTSVVEYELVSAARRPGIVPATALAEFEPVPPAAPPFGSTLPDGSYFPQPVVPADEVTKEAAIEAMFASAAFAEAAGVMRIAFFALRDAAREAARTGNVVGAMAANGLAIMLSLKMTIAAAAGVVLFFAVVSARPRGDGTYDLFTEIAPFGLNATCGACDVPGVTQATMVAIASLELTLTGVADPVSPIASFPSDDGGAAPAIGDTGDPGEPDGGPY